ncbi:cobalt ECF transporter T component CbiQ [Thiobaca trueperi]|uniref:Cobalt/nickel transport system permease protein n=1 Tax=Thiobaca trueperi TaxID=127458 RepID=A0A4V2V0Z8_9GAMM|nr:cobalt ECF transporter T component CbiQ [Thiobaca trueperi]TCT19272.1 cobalt/nickel transport system permease protein [Thiobaca trueperi]
MSGIDASLFDLGRLDHLGRQETPLHRLDPRAKILTTAVFLVCVVSFGQYDVAPLLPYAIFPIALASAGRIPFDYLLKKLLIVSPFALLVGIFNPLLDQEPRLQLGSLAVSGGWISFMSILLRFALTVSAALVLIAITRFENLCLGLQRLGVPQVFTLQLLFLYRYLFVLVDESRRLVRARALRSVGARGLGMRVYASLLGHLLLRTLDRARRIHIAMRCRGFSGEIRSLQPLRIGHPEMLFTLGWCGIFMVLRIWNLPQILGDLTLRLVT